MSENLIAHFKAKFGVSNRIIANLLDLSSVEAKKHIESDSFSKENNDLIEKIGRLIENMIRESELLQEQAPYILVLEHEKDLQELAIKQIRIKNDKLKKEITQHKNMSLFKRLSFLFNIRID